MAGIGSEGKLMIDFSKLPRESVDGKDKEEEEEDDDDADDEENNQGKAANVTIIKGIMHGKATGLGRMAE